MVRRGDKDNYFVGYTYKRKPTVNTRPSVASSIAGGSIPAEMAAGSDAALSGVGAASAAAFAGREAASSRAEAAPESRKVSPTNAEPKPSSGKSSPVNASRKSTGMVGFAGLFGGKKGAC